MIVVLTAPRSGSSLVCSILDAHGVQFGDCIPANQHNPKGYFENRQLNNLMKAAGKVSTGRMISPPEWWESSVRKVFRQQRLFPNAVGVKSNILRMPLWDCFEPVYLVVKRRPSDVIASNERAGMMKEAALLAQFAAIERVASMPGVYVCEPELFFMGDYGGLPSALDEAGFGFDKARANALLDGSLWHANPRS